MSSLIPYDLGLRAEPGNSHRPPEVFLGVVPREADQWTVVFENPERVVHPPNKWRLVISNLRFPLCFVCSRRGLIVNAIRGVCDDGIHTLIRECAKNR